MTTRILARLFLSRVLPVLMAFGGPGFVAQVQAQTPSDPPARVGTLSQIDGSVVFAPAGETEWLEAVPNRPITRGDRLWTDQGARAEVHVGSAVLHMDGQTLLEVTALDADVLQASLNEGSVNARVREVQRGENFEIDTPQLAFRAAQPGDWRLDVDPAQGTTRVTVHSGSALVYGANGQAQELAGGQVVTFAGRDLERVAVQAAPAADEFDRWAADRNRMEDQSIAARYVPREVVGYQQLDPYGSWAQDASYGSVWYPRITVADWAPYRYGHWDFIAPWGWTWVDDAPWGFAPFHYGRWAMIGSRWAWVPGRIGPHPVYAPALVAFAGGGGVNFSLSIGSGPGIGWFPLGPGEIWRPAYRTSPRYLSGVNRYIVGGNRQPGTYVHQNRPGAWTAVRVDDFSRGRPVNSRWQRPNQADMSRLQVLAQPALPQPNPNRFGDAGRAPRLRVAPPPQLTGSPFAGRPQPAFQDPGAVRREGSEGRRPVAVPRPQEVPRAQVQEPRRQPEPQVQQRQERPTQQQTQQQVRQGDPQRRMQMQQQQHGAREQERAQPEQQRAQREQQAPMPQRDPTVRPQQAQQERAMRQAPQPRVAPAPEAQQPRGGEGGGGRAKGRGDQRDENRSQGGDEGGRGRGRG